MVPPGPGGGGLPWHPGGLHDRPAQRGLAWLSPWLLQNTLSNLAGGIMILVSKPFEVGDYVEADGVGGTVISIGLAYSTLATVDNKEIFIPNSQVAAAKIINYTKLGKRRVELTFSASYDAPTETVKQALGEVLAQFPQILEDPAPSIWISKYGASSIEYVVRVWTAAGDYWDVYYGVRKGAPRLPAPRDSDDLRSSKRPPAGEVSPQTSRRPGPRGLQGGQPVEKAVQLGREDLAPDHCVFVDQQIGQDAGLTGGVVGDLVGVALHPLAGIFGQVEALPALQGQIVVIARIHLLGDEQLLGGQGLGTDLPAVGLEVGHPVLVALDPLWAGDGRGGRLPGGGRRPGSAPGRRSRPGRPRPPRWSAFGGGAVLQSGLSQRILLPTPWFLLMSMRGGTNLCLPS